MFGWQTRKLLSWSGLGQVLFFKAEFAHTWGAFLPREEPESASLTWKDLCVWRGGGL